MEQYWTAPSNTHAVNTVQDSTDVSLHAIAALHADAFLKPSDNTIVDAEVSAILTTLPHFPDGYHRVSCGEKTCEIVVVYPSVSDATSPATKIAVAFQSKLISSRNFSVTGPSVITAGDKFGNGLAILYYVTK